MHEAVELPQSQHLHSFTRAGKGREQEGARGSARGWPRAVPRHWHRAAISAWLHPPRELAAGLSAPLLKNTFHTQQYKER